MFKEGFVKQLWQLYLVEFFAGFYFPRAIVLLFLVGRGLSLAEIGLTVSVIYGFNLLFEYPTGIFADRFGRKKSLMIALCLYAVASLVYGSSFSLVGMLVASAVQGIAWAFQSGAREALVYDSLKQFKLHHLNKDVVGVMDAIGLVGTMVTTLFGPWLFGVSDGLPYLLNGVAYLIAGVFLFSFVEVKIVHHESLKKHVFAGVKWLWNKRLLRFLVVMGIGLFWFENAWYSVNQIILVNNGLPVSFLSWFYIIAGVLGIIAGFVLPKLVGKWKKSVSLGWVIGLQVIALVGISLLNPWLMLFLSYGMFLGHMWWNYVEADVIHKVIPSRIRATVLSGK
ncbi:MAG: MFS transporter, partial [Nanoarchaeota archaeon]|nr:MFS transporter [Nanoarchaeota archaeon]